MASPGAKRRTRLIAAALALAAIVIVAGIGVRLSRPIDRADIVARRTHHRIDVNAADAATLAALPGLGPGLAQRIVEHREAHGPFATPDDLAVVARIGPRTVDRLRPWIVCTPPRTLAREDADATRR